MLNQRPVVNEELLLKRYVQGDEKTWDDVALRVANHAAKTEDSVQRYYDLIHSGKFFPSRMTYMGTGNAFASSCFVFPVEDSLAGIMKTLNDACQVQKFGGGTGYNFSNLRPKGDLISTSGGDASGPVSFMGLFHNAMEVVHRAGKKHAAQMGILNCDHPDIFEFIHCKDQEGAYWTFNISVAVTDKFMDAVGDNLSWDLQFKGKVYKTIPARELWDAIVTHAWGNGDPGIIFLDTVNRFNHYPEPIEACNPCVTGETLVATPEGWKRVDEVRIGDTICTVNGTGEVKTIETHTNFPVLKVKFSNGSIIKATASHQFYVPGESDYEPVELRKLVQHDQVRLWEGSESLPCQGGLVYIDSIEPAGNEDVYDLYEPTTDTWITNGVVSRGCGEQMLPPYVSCNLGSIDLSRFVVEKRIDWQSLDDAVRGAVSFLDDSLDSAFWPVEEVQVKTARYRNIGLGVMGWSDMCIMLGLAYDSDAAVELGDGVMGFINSIADDESMLRGSGNRKNVTVTSIAPTGSISMLAGCSPGIEPLFGIVTTKNTYVGSFHNVHWLFEKIAKEQGFYSEELIKAIAERGSVQGLQAVPTDVQALFKTTTEIDWEWHVKHQAAFQKHTDNAVSKTINMASNARVFDVSAAYMTAYETGCKSITVYRDGSRQVQVMDNKSGARDMCPNCKAILFMKDGEKVCVTCGYKKTNLISEVKRARPAHLNGTTYRKDTPIGKAYVTVNTDAKGEPFEVFMNVGKAGSEVAAVSEGLGRLISLVLRMPSSVTPVERLRWIVDEISDIGGGRPMGFGAKRVRSLPDGIAQVLSEHLSGGNDTVDESPVASTKALGDICPECGEATLLNVEGCRKCQSCGYSEC